LRSPVSQPISIWISQLRAQVSGRVITPDDPAYDQARTIFYGGFDRHPAVIIRPVDTGQVARVVALARESALELAVRSGGHSTAGHSTTDGGIVLDLAAMRALDIDPQQRTAWAQTDTPAEGRTGRLVAAHFPDVAVSASSTALTIRTSADGEMAATRR
jgi:FAD binding domain